MNHKTLRKVTLGLVGALVVSIFTCGYQTFQKVSDQVRYEQELLALEKHMADLHEQEAINRRTATLLHELEPGDTLDLFGGMFEFGPSKQLVQRNNSIVRWYIPGKVKPVVYDELDGRFYSWFDVKTKELEGPFDPEVQK